MKKKIFLSGTVYDLSCTAPHEIESDLNKRLFKQIGKALTTHVSIDDANKPLQYALTGLSAMISNSRTIQSFSRTSGL